MMNGPPSRRRSLLIFGGVTLLSLLMVLANLQGGAGLSFGERVSMTLFAPFQRAIDWGIDGTGSLWGDYIALVDLKQHNDQLQETVDRLAFENNALVERLKQVNRVEELLASPLGQPFASVVSRVIGRDTSNRVRIVILDRGASHGVEEGMPVITHQGLVGRIVRTSSTVSKCLLITDVRSAVDAVTQESRDRLTTIGDNTETLDVRYLSFDADAHDGDRVVSSGMGGVFPAGLLVGALEGVDDRPDSLFKEARIVPAVDFNRLEEVLILKVALTPTAELKDQLAEPEAMERGR